MVQISGCSQYPLQCSCGLTAQLGIRALYERIVLQSLRHMNVFKHTNRLLEDQGFGGEKMTMLISDL